MNNIINYIDKNLKNNNYIFAKTPYYDNGELKEKELVANDIISFANYLHKKVGFGHYNNKIGILMSNNIQFVNAFYSIILNEYIVVAINDTISLAELNDIIDKNKLEYIITDDAFATLLSDSNIINLDQLYNIKKCKKLEFEHSIPKLSDVMVVSYTSGTSGNFSKGVLLTYENISFVSEEYEKVYELNSKSQIITVLPLWHNYAMFACLTSSIVSQATLIIMEKWNARLFIDINKYIKPDIFPGSPYMYIDLINNYSEDLYRMNNLKICDSGGDSLPISCIHRFEKLTGAIITEGYGLTETSSLTHFNYSASERKVGSLGKCVSNVQCKILDLNGKELSNNEWGLLWIKGPMVFKGYVGLENHVKNEDGWFNTNDVVRRDDDGFYYIAGRFSDLQTLSSEDGLLRELESSLYCFEGISRIFIKSNFNDLANFYYFDIAAILKDGYTIEDLYDYINKNLKKYIINKVEIVKELPTTGTGKIKRREITNMLIDDGLRGYENYKIKQLSGGLRCQTYLLSSNESKYIYQKYLENTKYQALKKFNVVNKIKKFKNIEEIPNLIDYGENNKYSWLITEYKEGQMLEQIRKDYSKFTLNSIMKDLVKVLYNIHQVPCDSKYGWITDTCVFEQEKFCDYLKSELSRFNNSVSDKIDEKSKEILLQEGKKAIKTISEYESTFHPQLSWYDINPNNLLVQKKNNDFKLSGFIDAGGLRYGIKEWDLAFLKMEVCINDTEYHSLLLEYKKLDNSINEKVIDALCVFVELDDMIIRCLDNISIPKPYATKFSDIIDEIEEAG